LQFGAPRRSGKLILNELWCTDYKGEFLLGNRQYCYPLTVTDHATSCAMLSDSGVHQNVHQLHRNSESQRATHGYHCAAQRRSAIVGPGIGPGAINACAL